jgi:hypothetical protein
VKGAKDKRSSKGARGVEGRASEGARSERGGGDGELKTMSEKKASQIRKFHTPIAKGPMGLKSLLKVTA